jgi:hypothetical protein
VRSFTEVTGQDLVWTGDAGNTIPPTGDFHFALYEGQDGLATARVTWQRQGFFDVTMECADGAYQSHMDLTRNDRQALVWKSGENSSVLVWSVAWELVISCGGTINTRGGRKLLLEPTHQVGYEYAIFPEGGARILTLAAWAKYSIGGNPGHMSIEPGSATDPDLPALVLLAFTVANEETRLLHQSS